MIFVNFKTYEQGTGRKAVELAHLICDIAGETGIEIISCPQAVDLREVVETSDHPVWAQHIDAEVRGQATGWLPPEVAKEAGAQGTLLNHSEHKLEEETLASCVRRAKEVGLQVLLFAATVEEAVALSELEPDFIGYEPPELVGSRTTSVASAKAGVIKEVVEKVAPLPVIVGAGVHSQEDVEISLKQGAVGVAVATDVVLAEDPKKELLELAEGFK